MIDEDIKLQLARTLTLICLDGREFHYNEVTQMYKVGNFMTISGKLVESNDSSRLETGKVFVVDRFYLTELKRMVVEFN